MNSWAWLESIGREHHDAGMWFVTRSASKEEP